jgi:hypothetical protein
VKLAPEDLDKLQTKQLANVIRKLNEGKTLTAREQQMLDDARAGGAADSVNFVRNWDDLAQELNVTRKSVHNWRMREDLRSAKDFPRPRADGRHDVNVWRSFMIAHGLNRADEDVDPENIPGERRTVRDWKMYREELSCTEAERRIARGDGLLLVATELEVPIGATFVSIQTKLSQFAPRVARFMVMCRDEAAAEDKLRDEMDAVLTDLNLAGYIDGAAEDVAREFPFNEECADLYARVSFAGQDRSLFVELVGLAVQEALRRIGRRALASTTSQALAETSVPISSTEASKDGESPLLAPATPNASPHSPVEPVEANPERARRKHKSVTRRRKT